MNADRTNIVECTAGQEASRLALVYNEDNPSCRLRANEHGFLHRCGVLVLPFREVVRNLQSLDTGRSLRVATMVNVLMLTTRHLKMSWGWVKLLGGMFGCCGEERIDPVCGCMVELLRLHLSWDRCVSAIRR